MNEAELFAFYEEQNMEVYENTASANAYAGACRCPACLSEGWYAPTPDDPCTDTRFSDSWA